MTPEPAKASAGEAVPCDDLTLEAVLARFGGDAHAALEAALSDVAYLRQELGFASLAMSYGFARGWKPLAEPKDAQRL
jgi:hypothetical protein